MNKEKKEETIAKILELLNGLGCKESQQFLNDILNLVADEVSARQAERLEHYYGVLHISWEPHNKWIQFAGQKLVQTYSHQFVHFQVGNEILSLRVIHDAIFQSRSNESPPFERIITVQTESWMDDGGDKSRLPALPCIER